MEVSYASKLSRSGAGEGAQASASRPVSAPGAALPPLAPAGGQLAFLLVELARGRRVDDDVEVCITSAGITALMLLGVYLLTQDLAQLAAGLRA